MHKINSVKKNIFVGIMLPETASRIANIAT
jgi:hypothetical protein